MAKLRRGLLHGLLALASIALPASAQGINKQLYQARIVDGLPSQGGTIDMEIGQAMMIVSQSGYEYMVRDNYYALAVDKVTLQIANDPQGRQVVLCDDDQLIPCTTTYGYFVDIAGSILPTMLLLAEGGPITPQEFRDALTSGTLTVRFNDGELGTGTFRRVF